MEKHNAMLSRYSLYGDPSHWNGNIQEDPEGRWLKWRDTEAYVQYALAHGYVPSPPEESTPQVREEMVEQARHAQVEMFDPAELATIDDSEDVYDRMIRTQSSERFDDEV